MSRSPLPAAALLAALLSILLLFPLAATAQQLDADFDALFTGRTLRFDYYHSGTAQEERISVDRLRLEGEWPGRRSRLLDATNLGKYRFVVVDPGTHLPLYSQAFASIYGEWETTGEARSGTWRTFHESQRFPEPRGPVQLVLQKRAADGTFRELFSTLVDPASRFVDRSPLIERGRVWALMEHGPAATKVDLLVLGDGYTEAELPEYGEDVRRVAEALFATPPFSDHREDFNVWAIDLVSSKSGVTRPRSGQWRNSPLGLTYNAFDSERYLLSFENQAVREIAALAPYDALILIANSEQYGGGGIFNLYTTAAAKSRQLPYLVVHEFGHSFAGLADEYYTSEVAYEEFHPPGTEPWEPNVTALLDPERLKWRELVKHSTPIPTPWDQEAYDRVALAFQEERRKLREQGAPEERLDEHFAEVKEVTSELLQAERHYGEVGAFEGASYRARGLYRPSADCIMFTRNPDRFCRVCSMAIERLIRAYTE